MASAYQLAEVAYEMSAPAAVSSSSIEPVA